MGRRVRILLGDVVLMGSLADNQTADAIWDSLPLSGKAARWGDEVYFTTDLPVGEAADARQDMQVGEIAYWPPGSAICLFFGPTPVSVGPAPRAYSNVNPCGMIEGDATVLRAAGDGQSVSIERIEG